MTNSHTQMSLEAGNANLANRSAKTRKTLGQFLTPEPIARFMAQELGEIKDGSYILDPALGSGTLLCAIIDILIEHRQPLEIWMDGFEVDCELYEQACQILEQATSEAKKLGIKIHIRLFNDDFVLNGVEHLRPSLTGKPYGERSYDYIIANPPYFKINTSDARREKSDGILTGRTNIYTLFMSLASKMIKTGNACFLVPRSFCSGAYFARFRRDFLQQTNIKHIHLFDSRNEAFNQDSVLQENVIITFTSPESEDTSSVEISSSVSITDLQNCTNSRQITFTQFVADSGVYRLPTSDIDELILQIIDSWQYNLEKLNYGISTGPVVPFRSKRYLKERPDTNTVPLLWMQHIKPQKITWPLQNGFRKSQYFANTSETAELLVENRHYVIIRRFSSKEEARRLVSAPLLKCQLETDLIGLENHLNYLYGCEEELSDIEAIGLSALLNCGIVDRYFRICNGHTQVNATDMRSLPLPSRKVICAIGHAIKDRPSDSSEIIVLNILKTFNHIPSDFPTLHETRST